MSHRNEHDKILIFSSLLAKGSKYTLQWHYIKIYLAYRSSEMNFLLFGRLEAERDWREGPVSLYKLEPEQQNDDWSMQITWTKHQHADWSMQLTWPLLHDGMCFFTSIWAVSFLSFLIYVHIKTWLKPTQKTILRFLRTCICFTMIRKWI